MKTTLLVLCLSTAGFSLAQNMPVFKNIEFDSTSKLIAMGASFSHIGEDSKEYCFLVDNLDELNKIKKDWVAKDVRPKISIEEYSINISVVKNNKLTNGGFLIYPKQGIINISNRWYDFDMKNFASIQTAYLLRYHSQTFSFGTYLDYAFFYDSLRYTNSYLFLYEPLPQFEGHFDIIATRSQDKDSPIFVLKDVTKELEELAPKNKFSAQNAINDPFNLNNTKQMKIRVSCSKTLYDAYKNDFLEKGAWVQNTVDAKVFFKD